MIFGKDLVGEQNGSRPETMTKNGGAAESERVI